jgi:hypothetical protein
MESHRVIVGIENSVQDGKEAYLSPIVEIIEIKVEKGFAASPVDGGGSSTGDWGGGGLW